MSTETHPQTSTAIERLVLHRMTGIEDALNGLTEQVGRLVLIEERQSQTSAALERAFKLIEALEQRLRPLENMAASFGQLPDLQNRVRTLELAAPITARTNIWAERALIALAGGVGAVVLKLILIP